MSKKKLAIIRLVHVLQLARNLITLNEITNISVVKEKQLLSKESGKSLSKMRLTVIALD